MRLLLAVIGLLVAGLAHANVARPAVKTDALLWSRAAAMNASGTTGGTILPHAVQITRANAQVTTAAGSTTGTTVITVTDGTNTCTLTFQCSQTGNGGAGTGLGATVPGTVANGAGTGCVYASGAVLSSTVTTANCTNSQPSLHLNVLGKPL